MNPLTFDSFQRSVKRNFSTCAWQFAHYTESFSAQWFANPKLIDAYTLLSLEVNYESRHRTWSITVQRVSSELTLKHRTSCRALAQECHVEVDPTVIRGRHPNLREQEAIEAIGGHWVTYTEDGNVVRIWSGVYPEGSVKCRVYRAMGRDATPVRLKE